LKPTQLLELVALAAIWGASFLFMRAATPEFGPIFLVEIRTLIAALFLIPVVLLTGKAHLLFPNAGRLLLVGITGTAIPFSLLSYATLYVTAGYASILNATTPIFTALIAWLWVNDRLTASAVAGLVVGFIGVIVLSFDKQAGSAQISVLPILAAMGATLCYGFSANFTRQKLQHVHPLALACGSQTSAALILMPLSLCYLPQQMPSVAGWVSVSILGIVCTASAFILYFRLIANVGVNKAVAVTYLIPFFGVVWGMLLLDEVLSLLMVMGALLILTGVSLTTGVFKLGQTS
jgi:drug/metabolite transporter (DMT)-like permease